MGPTTPSKYPLRSERRVATIFLPDSPENPVHLSEIRWLMANSLKGVRGNRNEINLSDEAISALTILAQRDNRKLKNYMEKILEDHAKENEPTKKK